MERERQRAWPVELGSEETKSVRFVQEQRSTLEGRVWVPPLDWL